VIAGFTGSQHKPPIEQYAGLTQLLRALGNITEGHHGDCIGADADFDQICEVIGIERHAHPGPDGPKRAYCESDVIHEPRPYLDRNRIIVDLCDVLIACPKGPEERRSGTWSTVRYARKQKVRIITVWPDGMVDL
jgi:hypothetical protein